MTFVDGTIKVDWSESVRIAQAAERAGFDAIIPVARWRGLGGEINFNHRCFETYTWAAGLAAVRARSASFRHLMYQPFTLFWPLNKPYQSIIFRAEDLALT
jgi:hypothetical protein